MIVTVTMTYHVRVHVPELLQLLYAEGPSTTTTDLASLDMPSILSQAAGADVIVVCIGEGNVTTFPCASRH